MKKTVSSVDDYIAAQPKAAQRVLQQVRRAIRSAVPDADEVISYQIPAYKRNGPAFIYFAGWTEHYSLYPASDGVLKRFKKELARYEVVKRTLRFPLSGRVPVTLIGAIAKLRAKEVAGGVRVKAQSVQT